VSQISEGFNQPKPASRTVVVTIDLSKVFDMVDITLLTEQISNSNLNHNYVRCLSTYLRGRSAACIYQGSRSKFRIVHIGVPQGSVLSPCLFNLYTSNFSEVSDTKVLFVDNIMLAVTGPDLQVIEITLNKDLAQVAKWAKKKRLSISASKSQATIFTPNNRELNVKPQIFFQGSKIPVGNLIKILELTIDSLNTYTPQEKNAASSGRSGHRVIKAAQGTDWGLSKKDGLKA
jgi:hypothetical protein